MTDTRGTTRSIWTNVAWAAALVLTALTGLVVGYGSVWLQFFGDSADAGDYEIAAGAYAAAAGVLVVGAVAVVAHRGPKLVAAMGVGVAAVYVLLSLDALAVARRVDDDGYGSVAEGVGSVLAMPWTWPLVVLGVIAPFRLLRGR